MKMGLLQLLTVVLISIVPRQIVPIDIAPPPEQVEQTATLTLEGVIVPGLIVAFIVIVSVLVIRAIRRKNPSGDES